MSRLKVILTSSSRVAAGDLLGGLCMLLATVIIARDLGPELFGILAIMLSFTQLVNQLFNFNSWRTLIPYGAEPALNNESEKLKHLVSYCVLADWLTGLLACLFSLSVASLVHDYFISGGDQDYLGIMHLLCLIIFFQSSDGAKGVYRLFSQYSILALTNALSGIVLVLACITAYFLSGSLLTYVMAYLASAVLMSVIKILLMSRIINRHVSHQWFVIPDNDSLPLSLSKLNRHMLISNFDISLRALVKNVDVLVISAVTQNTSLVGIYRVAIQFVGFLMRPIDALINVFMPEAAKLMRQTATEVASLTVRICLVVAVAYSALWICFTLWGDVLLGFVYGNDYLMSYQPAIIYFLAMIYTALMTPFSSLLLAQGLAQEALVNQLVAVMVFIPALIIMTNIYGLTGAAASFFVYAAIWLLSVARVFSSNQMMSEICNSRLVVFQRQADSTRLW